MPDQTALDLHRSSKSVPFRQVFRRLIWELAVTIGLLLAGPAANAGNWDHAHGDAGNTGFNDVVTQPAGVPSATIGNLGPFAPGSGPVVAPDGTVYLASYYGSLRAFSPNGALKWKRDNPGQRVFASPVVGADGSIYVASTRVARDHRNGRGGAIVYDSTLFRFSPGGAVLWKTPFPLGYPAFPGSGQTSAAPNIWRYGETEVIIVPAIYNIYELRLIAFSTSGALLFNQLVTAIPPSPITGSGDWGLCTFFPCIIDIFGLGPVDIHFNAMTAVVRLIMAAKL